MNSSTSGWVILTRKPVAGSHPQNDSPEAELPGETVIAGLAAGGWRGRVGDLEPVELEAFWLQTLVYARWEIGRYQRWRGQEEPVLADGYDAEGIVQGAFARLMSREMRGVPPNAAHQKL